MSLELHATVSFGPLRATDIFRAHWDDNIRERWMLRRTPREAAHLNIGLLRFGLRRCHLRCAAVWACAGVRLQIRGLQLQLLQHRAALLRLAEAIVYFSFSITSARYLAPLLAAHHLTRVAHTEGGLHRMRTRGRP